MVHPDDADAVRAAWERAHEEGEDFSLRATVRQADGGWRRALIAGGPTRHREEPRAFWVYLRPAPEDETA
jgi:hypothetical protein